MVLSRWSRVVLVALLLAVFLVAVAPGAAHPAAGPVGAGLPVAWLSC